ncbi:micrococcal nuclease [Chryseobacterium ginsenosidimutans]|uniref:thermonuclease family protein n=1 Tax=Chryseobacterium ginsenosidimutans TaxID=687846 RepID=UPI00278B9DAE|nr:thermonuclease family protein [Chryseobacterium ginsenosidimutans]MDQ0592717.1 micrococcal nuclease [Chryseobacterium ginsenosidimutans]
MKKFIYIKLLLISTLIFSQTKGKIIKIKDGDTVVVLLSDKTQETLRLAEVDCPENSQAFGKNAKQFTSSQVFGETVMFYRIGKDRYRRTIAKIFYGNEKYLSAEIIKAGFGWWYFKASKNIELYNLQNLAKEKKLGLWVDNNAMAPWDFRKSKRKVNTIQNNKGHSESSKQSSKNQIFYRVLQNRDHRI